MLNLEITTLLVAFRQLVDRSNRPIVLNHRDVLSFNRQLEFRLERYGDFTVSR